MKNRISAAVRTLCVLTAAALMSAALSGCNLLFVPDVDLESYIKNNWYDDIDTSAMTVISWDEEKPEASFDELISHLQDCEEKIAITGHEEFGWEDICYRAFWVDEFSVTTASGKALRVYEFTYKEDADVNRGQAALVDVEVDKIISEISKDADDWEKILAIHDRLVELVTYVDGENDDHKYDMYGALVNHKAVCQGYTYAMRYILDKLGIASGCISSETHIWNRINDIGESEKYIDITWDDTDEYDLNGDPYIFHSCFMITGEEMERLEDHYAEETLPDDGKKTGGNYFRHRGGIIPSGKNNEVSAEIARQIETGTNLVELRFVSKKDYDEVLLNIDDYVEKADYDDAFIIWNDDELRVLSVGLYPTEDE